MGGQASNTNHSSFLDNPPHRSYSEGLLSHNQKQNNIEEDPIYLDYKKNIFASWLIQKYVGKAMKLQLFQSFEKEDSPDYCRIKIFLMQAWIKLIAQKENYTYDDLRQFFASYSSLKILEKIVKENQESLHELGEFFEAFKIEGGEIYPLVALNKQNDKAFMDDLWIKTTIPSPCKEAPNRRIRKDTKEIIEIMKQAAKKVSSATLKW